MLYRESGPLLLDPPVRAKPWRKWENEERMLLAGMLAALEEQGASLTEVSDARELVLLPRLSEAPPRLPLHTVQWLATDEGQALLEKARALRALYISEINDTNPEAVQQARKRGGLKGARPEAWRLGELQWVFKQARLIELWLERREER